MSSGYLLLRLFVSVVFGFAVIVAFDGLTRGNGNATVSSGPLSARLQADAAALAKKHGIPAPVVTVTDSTTSPGVTLPPLGNAGTSPSRIFLGETIQGERLSSAPELQRALLAHEFGHALANARGTGFPIILVLIVMAVPVMIVLMGFPTLRGIVLGGICAVLLLSLLHHITGSAETAVQWLVLCGVAAAVLELAFGRELRLHLAAGAPLLNRLA